MRRSKQKVEDYQNDFTAEDRIDEPIPKKTKPSKVPRYKKEKASKPPREFQRSISDVLKSRIFLGFLCIFVALVTAFVALPIVQGIISERVPVVIFSADVSKGTLLTPDLLSVSEIGAVDRPQNAASSIEQVSGTYAAFDMLKGDLVTSPRLSREQPLQNAYLYHLPEGKTAVSVSVKGLAEGLSGKLRPGDIVTVYAVFNKSDTEEDYRALQPRELKYIKVLAVSYASGDDLDADVQELIEMPEADRLPAVITLLAGDMQAAALTGLERNATIHIGLAARADDPALCEGMLSAQQEEIERLRDEQEEIQEEQRYAGPSEPEIPGEETEGSESNG